MKEWMINTATILFDDTKNDLRSLPKAVRLQILIVLSFVWSTVFSLYVFSMTSFIFGWAGVVMGHIGLIIAVYLTFKFFHKKQEHIKMSFRGTTRRSGGLGTPRGPGGPQGAPCAPWGPMGFPLFSPIPYVGE